MDYQHLNYVLETAISNLKYGRLSEASSDLGEIIEAVRFPVPDADRGHAATIVKMTRNAATGGDWKAQDAKAKMYKRAGAKKAGARAHDQAHAKTVNPPKYETKAPKWKYRSVVKKEAVEAVNGALAFLKVSS